MYQAVSYFHHDLVLLVGQVYPLLHVVLTPLVVQEYLVDPVYLTIHQSRLYQTVQTDHCYHHDQLLRVVQPYLSDLSHQVLLVDQIGRAVLGNQTV